MLSNFLAGLLVFIVAFFSIIFTIALFWGIILFFMLIFSVIPPVMLIASLVLAFFAMIAFLIWG